jgi:hypothetical protein
MEIVIAFILVLLILLSILIFYKRKIKNFAGEIYELNYDSVTFDDLLVEIEQIKKQKIIDYDSIIEKILNNRIVIFLLWAVVISLGILVVIWMAAMMLFLR